MRVRVRVGWVFGGGADDLFGVIWRLENLILPLC